jgi:exportin-7
MDAAQLAQLEGYCNSMFNATSQAERAQAHQALLPLTQNPQCVPQLQFVLAHTSSPHALIFSATALTKLVTSHWTTVSDRQKEEMRTFLFDYLAKNGPDLYRSAAMAVSPVVRLLCRVIKLAWLEGPQYQNVTDRVGQFLQSSPLHWVLGLQIYTDLTTDMQPSVGLSMSRFRRTALSFRDTALPSIFTIALQTLQQLVSGSISIPDKNDERRLMKQVLQLACNCLSFDFMGTIPDETSDEQSTVMVPHSWNMLRDEGIPKLFFDLYSRSCSAQLPECAQLSLMTLVMLSALRRSFFQKEEDRHKLLASMMQGTTGLLASKMGLQDHNCYHEMCRLLGKINATHQLNELCASADFQIWIEQVYSFTMDSLRNWERMPNSKHYLLSFWASMVSPVILLQDKAPKALESYIQQVTVAYVESRLFMAEASADPNNSPDWDDPLQDEVLRTEQLEVLSNLGRCRYQDTAQCIMKHFEEISRVGQAGAVPQPVFEKKMTWLVYMMGALVGGHASAKTNRADTAGAPTHVVNGELAGRVFRLVDLTDQQTTFSEELELSYMYFLEQFRKVYIGEHAKQVVQQQVSERLATVLGLEDENAVLGLLIKKIGKNLQSRFTLEPVLKKTLSLFHDLAAGINIVHTADRSPHLIVSGRLLLKNDMVKYILSNHASPEFGFLTFGIKYGKYRTMYYHTLGKLLFTDIRDKRDMFEKFMEPQAMVINNLFQQALQGTQALRQDSCKGPLIGLCRDLRGIGLACTSYEPYSMLFDWLVDNPKNPTTSRVTLFSRALDAWWDDPEVTTPLLKFVAEFVHNKAQRIAFDQSSPNGILLFREASTILVTYGTRILQRTQFRDLYVEKYKGIGVSLDMFSHALHGNYTNFGVFELYADSSLSNSMALALRMCLAIPLHELSAFLKALKPYYFFLELATRSHMAKVMELEPGMLTTIVQSVEEGLLSFETGVSMQSCATVDNMISFFHTQLGGKPTPEQERVRRFLGEAPQCFQKILHLMFQLVMTGEFSSTWSISRPLLGLVLLHEQYFLQLKEQLVSSQIEERRPKLRGYFDDLMAGVENNLNTKNKDHFTRNLYNFAQVVRTLT